MSRLAFVFRILLYGWLLAIGALFAIVVRRLRYEFSGDDSRDARASPFPCVPIREPAFVKPDPLIYAQYYLSSLGFAVTWDNPDIELRLNGQAVSSSDLQKDTGYQVVARISNASLFAPVVQMPVSLSDLDFGIGTVRIPIGSTKIDLGVLGGPNHPAFAVIPWHTPKQEGHYCLLVELEPFDDLNFFNNLGQENTNVGLAHSPADFAFTLRNDTQRRHTYRLEPDAYVIPEPLPCDDCELTERERQERAARHRRGGHPVPHGWHVEIVPDMANLEPEESITIKVAITPPPSFNGKQPINVNAFHEQGLAGGVTLNVVVN